MKPSLIPVLILVCAAGSCWAQSESASASGATPAQSEASDSSVQPQSLKPPSPPNPGSPPAASPAAATTPSAAAQLPPKRKTSGTGAQTTDEEAKSPYVIGPLDVLIIKVWNNPNLSGPVDVGPDGMISLSLIGELKADGLTARQLKGALTQRLSDFLNSPEVDVTVAKINSKKYYVYGGVLRSGEFPLVEATTVMDALSEVGGFRDFANTKKIYILRGAQRFNFNYKEVSKGKKMEQNILLQNGDRIFVPE